MKVVLQNRTSEKTPRLHWDANNRPRWLTVPKTLGLGRQRREAGTFRRHDVSNPVCGRVVRSTTTRVRSAREKIRIAAGLTVRANPEVLRQCGRPRQLGVSADMLVRRMA